ncbi:MAG TPA: hypothetical protein VFK05_22995 [Polyangiaceae bacterium]|nr:hypothetical protein [Polyangiaceae bacterium]
MKHLLPCPGCRRHVRVSEVACPFCKAPLDLGSAPEPELPRTRLSRAATFAFGATLASVSALAACGADVDDGKGGAGSGGAATAGGAGGAQAGGAQTGPAQAGAGSNIIPVYGAPAGGAPPTSPGGGQGNNAGSAQIPIYGAAP